VLDVMLEPGFLERVGHIAQVLRARVEDVAARFPHVIELVRGKGLMLGLKCRIPNTELSARLLANGLLTVGAGDNVVRLLPPLIIGESEVDEAVAILSRTFSEVAR
jgi:acetylornithine/N-succinyldiaminopimelate aminotransferase